MQTATDFDAYARAVAKRDVRALCKALFNEDLKPRQVVIVRAIAFRLRTRAAIRAPTQWGKTKAVGIGIALRLVLHRGQKVAVLSPTNRQSAILRGYVSDCVIACDYLRTMLSTNATGADRLRAEVTKKKVTFKDGSLVEFLSLEGKAERIMGLGGYDLVVEDEAGLVPDEVHRVRVTRMLAKKGAALVLISNPWSKAHHFHEACESKDFLQVHVTWKDGLEDGTFSQAFLDEQRRTLSPSEWSILYEAEFPDLAEDQLIPWSWIQRSIQKAWTPPLGELWHRCWGMDCAEGGGDENVMTLLLRGPFDRLAMESQTGWFEADTDVTSERASNLVRGDVVGVDEGGVGKGIADNMRARGTSVHSFKAGREAAHKERFFNLFSEAAWGLRTAFEQDRIVLVNPSSDLLAELTRYRWNLLTGRTRVTVAGGKGGGNSPDHGDSLVHAYWTRPVMPKPVPLRRAKTLL